MDQPPPASPDEVRDWLVDQVASYIEAAPADIDPSVPLTQYGIDSVYAFVMCADIEDRFGIEVEPTVAWDYRTVDSLAEHLSTIVVRR